MKLKVAAKKLEDRIEETLTYMNFLYEYWNKIRTNNTIERHNREKNGVQKWWEHFPMGSQL